MALCHCRYVVRYSHGVSSDLSQQGIRTTAASTCSNRWGQRSFWESAEIRFRYPLAEPYLLEHITPDKLSTKWHIRKTPIPPILPLSQVNPLPSCAFKVHAWQTPVALCPHTRTKVLLSGVFSLVHGGPPENTRSSFQPKISSHVDSRAADTTTAPPTLVLTPRVRRVLALRRESPGRTSPARQSCACTSRARLAWSCREPHRSPTSSHPPLAHIASPTSGAR